MIHLDERLETAASFVRSGSVAADIGTDHGYLICSLVERGTVKHGYACDINEQPLAKAAETVDETGLGDKISLVLCDGLSGLEPNCADDIIIAGMGGELICSILSAADWLRSPDVRLILQPMSKADELRRYLCHNGFEIFEEKAAFVGKHIYTVICAGYTGAVCEPDELFLLIGKLAENPNIREKQYIEHQQKICISVGNSLLSGGYGDAAQKQFALAEKIASLL
ncbi:MAG: SAM-dependent methyltransferase [Oscillospiraceae bacterium]|nr:SAM-dependent methyltransferase [Oscillospiraceae bacterium]MBQ3049571.1 SAM-dependent methyltransferase [Oscillospiraceae bacterium]